MADYNASLPIQSITEGNSVKISKDVNANAVANPMWVELTDGTTALGVTGTSLDVNITGGSITADIEGDYVDDTAFAVTTDIGLAVGGIYTTDEIDSGHFGAFKINAKRELFVAQDTAASLNMTEASASAIKDAVEIMDDWDESDRAAVNTIAGQAGVAAAAGAVDALTQRVTLASDDPAVTALQIIDDWDDGSDHCQVDISTQTLTAVKISATAAANTALNPIFVDVVGSNVAGSVHYYDKDTIAAGLTAVSVKAVTAGKTMLLHKVICTASGAAKYEIQYGAAASLATIAVCFTTSGTPYAEVNFNPPLPLVEAGGTEEINIIKTNRDNQSQDVYVTIMATEV